MHDVGLLQVGLRRRRQRACEQQAQETRFDRTPGILAMRTVLHHADQFIQARPARFDGQLRAEPLYGGALYAVTVLIVLFHKGSRGDQSEARMLPWRGVVAPRRDSFSPCLKAKI